MIDTLLLACQPPPTMPLATFAVLTLTLRPQVITPLDTHTGRFFNGVVYRLLERVNPVLSKIWHDERIPKPFTVSTLQGTTSKIRGVACAMPDQTYTLRLTILDSVGYRGLVEAVTRLLQSQHPLLMKQYPFTIEDVALPDATSGTAMVGAAALLRQHHPGKTITFDFLSPTAFKKDQLTLLFPQPWNVFGSLLRNWEAFAPTMPLHPDLRIYMEHHVAVSKYRLESAYYDAMGYQLKGFIGRVTYQLTGKDAISNAHLQTLADFAPYAGVGMKTTQGMGQVRRVH